MYKKTFCGSCCENLNDLKDFIELKDLGPQELGPIEITYVLFEFPQVHAGLFITIRNSSNRVHTRLVHTVKLKAVDCLG